MKLAVKRPRVLGAAKLAFKHIIKLATKRLIKRAP
jgi:hypothetical protein